MLRKVTLDIGRLRAGTMHDFPRGVWTKIAADLYTSDKEAFGEVKLKDVKAITQEETQRLLDVFSEAVDFNPTHQALTRGNVRVRHRLGAPTR